MTHLILQTPLWLSSLIIVVAFSAAAALTPLLIRKRIPHERIKPNNEVGGFIYSALGLIYGVILAFVVLFVFEDYNRARHVAESEAGNAVDLFRITSAYPEPLRTQARNEIQLYLKHVVSIEWKRMADSDEDHQLDRTIHRLWDTYTEFAPSNFKEQVAHGASLQHLGNLSDYRRLRLLCGRTDLPGYMWSILIVGALLTITFSFLFGAPNVKAQAVMSAILTMMICLTLLLIFQLDRVYSSRLAIQPEAFEMAIQHLNR